MGGDTLSWYSLAWHAQNPGLSGRHPIHVEWWHTPIILAVGRRGSEKQKPKVKLNCILNLRQERPLSKDERTSEIGTLGGQWQEIFGFSEGWGVCPWTLLSKVDR